MSLDKITAQIKATSGKLPPVELWNPPYCGELSIEIKADGSWFYQGTVFKRQSLVKLLASVLKKEGDEHFLVTPVEKIKISVEDAPFVLTQWHWAQEGVMVVETNLGDEFILDASHPLTISKNENLYIEVRRGLLAKVHRNVYYQWVDLAKTRSADGKTTLYFTSADSEFTLGFFDDE